MLRAELVASAALLASAALVLSGVRWAWIAHSRSSARSARMTQNASSELATSNLSMTRAFAIETSTSQSFVTDVYPSHINITERPSSKPSSDLYGADQFNSEHPTTQGSSSNTSDRIFLNRTDIVTVPTISSEKPESLTRENRRPRIHTNGPDGVSNTTQYFGKEVSKTSLTYLKRNNSIVGKNNSQVSQVVNSANITRDNSESAGHLEHRTNPNSSDKPKTLNESSGFSNVSLSSMPAIHSYSDPLNKSVVSEALEKHYHTTKSTVIISENMTVPTSVEPSVVGLNYPGGGGDGPVSFGGDQKNDNRSQTTNSTDDDVDYVKMGQELVAEAITLLDTGIWDFERRTEDGDVIFSRTLDNGNTVYRLTGIVDMPAQDLLVIIYDGLADYPKWNPTLLECRVLENATSVDHTASMTNVQITTGNGTLLPATGGKAIEFNAEWTPPGLAVVRGEWSGLADSSEHQWWHMKINDQTDISYTVSAPGARGYVASRDFVSLRHWDVFQNTYVAATKSIDFLNAPSNPDYIRGQNGAGCMELRPLSSDPLKTEFRWLLNARLNGWIPSYIADKAYKKFMTKYMVFLRQYCKKVKQRAAEALALNTGNNTTPPT